MIATRGRAWGNALGGYRLQKRSRNGQFASGKLVGSSIHKNLRKRKGGFVPYARKGVGHSTVGLNTGLRVSKNRRISAGFYVRTDNDSGAKKARDLAKKQELAQLAIASRMPTDDFVTLGGNLRRVKTAQSKALYKTIGKEKKRNAYTFTRVGTDRNSLPTMIVRFNSPKDKRTGGRKARNAALVKYNVKNATGKHTYAYTQKGKRSRPQRRKSGKG